MPDKTDSVTSRTVGSAVTSSPTFPEITSNDGSAARDVGAKSVSNNDDLDRLLAKLGKT